MKILKYRLMTEVNHGTEDNPNIVQTFNDCVVKCKNGTFDDAYALSMSEAYNGEVTVEDDGKPEPAPNQLDRIEAQTTYTAMMTDTLMEG